MENIRLDGTDILPAVDFNFSANRFAIGGYSFPENVKDFFDPIFGPLTQHLEALEGAQVEVTCAFIYFHSSTAQVLFGLFDVLDACAARGNAVTLTWCYESDDDGMHETGEDIAEEFGNMTVVLKEVPAA
ncbi:MAG: DUF1987 domain-containing protein [Hyphomicrobiales bacterium]|nr:DUF1987 domain-containing protein [Hyphomicrobiales bacterium]